MLIILFVPLSAVAAAAAFYCAYHWLRIPFLNNALGALCIFLAVLFLGGTYAPSNGPWAYDEGLTLKSHLVVALQFLGGAVIAYFVGYVVRRKALKAGYADNSDDDV